MDTIFTYFAEHFDLPILDWIAANLHCAFLDTAMPTITVLGNAGIFWILTAAALLISRKHRQIGLGMGIALTIGLLICNVTLKPLCGRIRPYDYQLEHYGRTIRLLIAAQHDFSFPSGHTIASFEAATVLLLHNKKFGIPALVLAVLIAFSRLYLYVHYPTDVICSILLGTAIGYLSYRLVKYYHTRKSSH